MIVLSEELIICTQTIRFFQVVLSDVHLGIPVAENYTTGLYWQPDCLSIGSVRFHSRENRKQCSSVTAHSILALFQNRRIHVKFSRVFPITPIDRKTAETLFEGKE